MHRLVTGLNLMLRKLAVLYSALIVLELLARHKLQE